MYWVLSVYPGSLVFEFCEAVKFTVLTLVSNLPKNLATPPICGRAFGSEFFGGGGGLTPFPFPLLVSGADGCVASGRLHGGETALPVKNQLRVLRAAREWSQAELADRLGVSRQTVNAIETGKYDPSLPLAFQMADLFQLSLEAIFQPDRTGPKANLLNSTDSRTAPNVE